MRDYATGERHVTVISSLYLINSPKLHLPDDREEYFQNSGDLLEESPDSMGWLPGNPWARSHNRDGKCHRE